MRITCLYQFLSTGYNSYYVTKYIKACYPPNYQWRFNKKRLIWHIKNNNYLRDYILERKDTI